MNAEDEGNSYSREVYIIFGDVNGEFVLEAGRNVVAHQSMFRSLRSLCSLLLRFYNKTEELNSSHDLH